MARRKRRVEPVETADERMQRMIDVALDARNTEKKPKIITHAYVMGDGNVVGVDEIIGKKRQQFIKSKALEDGSNQEELRPNVESDIDGSREEGLETVEPPYDAAILAKFFEADEFNYRCCRAKVTDAICRGHQLKAINPDDPVPDDVRKDEAHAITAFMKSCNRYHKFRGVFEQAALDYESVGWGAIEVVRSFDKRVAKLIHIPAEKIYVLKGWKGFAEMRNDGTMVYYQEFGDKVVSKNRTKMDQTPEPFDPELDGDWSNATWNVVSAHDMKPQSYLAGSANELLFIPKYHPKTIYYGLPDIIPAIGYALANLNIRDFLLQFFDHNAVPQYAIVIEGADLSPEVKSVIASYFARDVKGQQHKTLIIPVPSQVAGEIKVHFEKLDQGQASGHNEDRKANQESIMVAHGMPPAIIGVADTANIGSGKGTAQMENYRERIVQPLQEMWQEIIDDLFRVGLGITHIGVRFDPYSVEERSVLRKDMIESLKMGTISINQYRDIMKLGKPVPGGDRLFIMTTGGPIFVDELAQMSVAEDKIDAAMDELKKAGVVPKEEKNGGNNENREG